jgi:hypothetical protein
MHTGPDALGIFPSWELPSLLSRGDLQALQERRLPLLDVQADQRPDTGEQAAEQRDVREKWSQRGNEQVSW